MSNIPVCLCVWVAYEPIEHLFHFRNDLIQVIILQQDQNPDSAARSVSFNNWKDWGIPISRFLVKFRRCQ